MKALITALVVLCACGRAPCPVPAPVDVDVGPDQRTGFEGVWSLQGTIYVNGDVSVNGPNTFTIIAGEHGRLEVVDPHGCVQSATVYSDDLLEIAATTCPAWFDTAGCSIVASNEPGSGELVGSTLTLYQTSTSARTCPGSSAQRAAVSAVYSGERAP